MNARGCHGISPSVSILKGAAGLGLLWSGKEALDFAKSGQVFENATLPFGACFVPRIIQKDANTLRCYFTSEDPGKRQSQMWFRDFDLKAGEFMPTIHKAGRKSAVDHSFFIFVSLQALRRSALQRLNPVVS